MPDTQETRDVVNTLDERVAEQLTWAHWLSWLSSRPSQDGRSIMLWGGEGPTDSRQMWIFCLRDHANRASLATASASDRSSHFCNLRGYLIEIFSYLSATTAPMDNRGAYVLGSQ